MFQVAVITLDDQLANDLDNAMEGVARTIKAAPNEDAINQFFDTLLPDLVVFDTEADLDTGGAVSDIVRRLRDSHPTVPIVAIGDEAATQTVLRAMRAGANDFIDRALERSELSLQVSAHLKQRTPQIEGEAGLLISVMSGRSSEIEGTFAANLATLVALGQPNSDILLLDFEAGASDVEIALDLSPNYTIRDAVDDLARLDKTLLTSAVSRHKDSGLYVLTYGWDGSGAVTLNTSSITSLLSVVRTMFDAVVVNIGGLRYLSALEQVVVDSDLIYLLTTQNMASVKAISDVLRELDLTATERAKVTLMLMDYAKDINLTEDQIKATLSLDRTILLADSRRAVCNSLNLGKPIVMDQPKSLYTRTLNDLLAATIPAFEPVKPRKGGLFSGLTKPQKALQGA